MPPADIGLVQAIVLGAVQGLTEFLPISSSAHLVLVPWLLGWSDPGLTFDVALHLGTLAAILAYFWRDIGRMVVALARGLAIRKPLAEPDARLGLLIAAGSIPGAVAGYLGDKPIEAYFHRAEAERSALAVIALVLILMGLLLGLAELVARHRRELEDLRLRDAVVIGTAQMLALIPGVSRSGSTLTAGLFLELRRETAARFSFLLALPITFGAALKQALDLWQGGGIGTGDRAAFAVGVLVAGLVGFACIAFLLRYLRHNSTLVFTIYRVALGLLVLVLLLLR
jgi:undecaprenyl-diphosphatase